MPGFLESILERKRAEIAAARGQVPLRDLQGRLADAPPVRDFVAALRNAAGVGLIAEIKRSSPSAGIIREDFDPVAIARAYGMGGAACLSVLTDETGFGGRLEFLTAVREVSALPLLRKDFVLDEYQVLEARVAGADAVLLIADCLSPSRLAELHASVLEHGMTPLVELHDQRHLPAVLECRPRLVGVNNRDLATFVVDTGNAIRLREKIPKEIPMVAESGIRTRADVDRLAAAGIEAMLVGESLMRQADLVRAVRELLGD